MAVVKKIAGLIAIAVLSYYAPGWGTSLAGSILGAGASAAATSFLGAVIGAVIIAAGSFAIQAILGASQRAPKMEAGKVNVRISDPPRWLTAGRARQGGGALFGDFDSQGRFWYIIVHSDEILHTSLPLQYYLDDEAVTLDGSNYVQQAEFRLKTNKDKDPAETDGEGRGYIRIWTRTYSETNPVPGRVAEFDAAMGSLWTLDHKLVGTTYSVVCMDALPVEHRYKIYRWRGPFGLGEPSVSIAGDWANIYDPRDEAQVLGDRTTYKPSRNAALIWAWFRTHPFGRNKPESAIDWVKIAEQADICDQTVTGIEGDQPRYEAGVSIVDSKRRADAEREIMLACDAQIFFGETGLSYVLVGHWQAPTLSFSRNRDIMGMATQEAQDGESETQGVIVKYMEPEANFTIQPSAAWINPLYYDPLTTPKFLTVEIQACQNHNQAMRLAKAIGMRSQPRHKIGPTVNLRGLRARQERIVTINYDNTFAGDYEIATPVELDSAGIFTGFGAVPVSPTRWTLLPGEEQPKPVVDGSEGTVSFPAITGENVYFSDGTIKIDFPALPRDDATYVAEYILTSEITGGENDTWQPMSININTAVSVPLPDGNYTVRYRYVVTSGRGPAWEYATLSVESELPSTVTMAVQGGVNQAVLTWKNPVDLRFFSSDIWRGTSAVFGSATKIVDNFPGGLGEVQSYTDTPLSAGQYYYWIVANDGAALEADPFGPVSADVGAFDFTGGVLPSGATFARSSAGQRTNVAGSLVSEAADVARFDYHPTTHALLGLLYEPSTDNEVVNSGTGGAALGVIGSGGALPTGWTMPEGGAGLTREIVGFSTVNGVDIIDIRFYGTASATTVLTLRPDNAGAAASIGQTWTNSAFLALIAGSLANVANLQMRAGSEGGGTLLSGLTATLARYTNTRTLTATSARHVIRYNWSAAGAPIDFTLRIGLPQRELGGKVTSPIKTSGAVATRAADALTLNWGARGVADGAITMRVTFDDGSKQDVAGTVASGTTILTTSLNRSAIRRVSKI
ncbi:hypothetical protein [Sphingobium sp. WCS2017Hpa-17]|uniref:phage head spike fiber domain-containing protein n=1 Tax=Sphingobium sp. WCS2017Hpa-17 TaxID=3073638 RepID=UPI00288C54BD|nr:hypothetical protein [Sphingobium sp. WCS2017Hpa-17]